MADGWETARRRDAGHDWATIHLACEATPLVTEIATTHYRGNSPDRVALFSDDGTPLLPETRVQPDTTHRFRLTATGPITHIRLHSYPDGGIARFRLYGHPSKQARKALTARWADTTPPA
jgi:allantoicase